MPPNWNLHQQIFAICLASNVLNPSKMHDTQAKLQKAMYEQLVKLLKEYTEDRWKIGWGPVVWKENPEDTLDGPGNAWFVAHNPSLQFEDGSTYDTYVVSIAGSSSAYDWITEDFGVNYVVDFNAWVSSGIDKEPQKRHGDNAIPFISYGAAGGVYHIVTEPVPSGPTGVGTGTLIPFLSSIPTKGTKVIFTGMSLGGALSPTLALATLKRGVFKDFRPQDVLVYPVAGPTAGNGPFAKLFGDSFSFLGEPDYQCWNANIVNRLDIVPQAWCDKPLLSPEQNLGNIISIYGPPLGFVRLLVFVMAFLANLSRVTYIPIRPQFFQGKSPPTPPKNRAEWVKAATQEHETEYMDYIGVHVLKHVIREPGRIFGGDSEGDRGVVEFGEGLEEELE
jgi:hypothetical protein